MTVEIELGYKYGDEVRRLFAEYTQMLVANEPGFAAYLRLQNYEAEQADLSYKYGLPEGRLYVIKYDGEIAGCGALRKLNALECELKRFFIKPEFRRRGLAEQLLQKIIGEAKAIGYRRIFLDTFPFLQAAIKLYYKYGFCETAPYTDSPLADTIYLKLDLQNYKEKSAIPYSELCREDGCGCEQR